uniref:Uncharacterized protein n=1 Tax=Ditylenchus dipsaci TaxID=166011 RepID=A0A915CQJ2_9BILA
MANTTGQQFPLANTIGNHFPLANTPVVQQPLSTFLPPKDTPPPEQVAAVPSSSTPIKQLQLNANILQAFSPALRITPAQKVSLETESKPESKGNTNEVALDNWGEPAAGTALLLPEQMMEDALRSVSVKAESNYGGVSSSCYESLSDSDDAEEEKTKKPATKPDGQKAFAAATTMYSVLSLPTITEQKECETSGKVSTPLIPFTGLVSSVPAGVIAEDTKPQLPSSTDTSVSQQPTCIYEPLSDDDD